MALINCPECKKEISDKTNACPHCGYPIKKDKLENYFNNTKYFIKQSIKNISSKTEEFKKENPKLMYFIITFLFVLAIAIAKTCARMSYYKSGF